MRTVKESMRNFFAAIFCFLMNLIPEKKVWAMVNAGLNENVVVCLKRNRNSGQTSNNRWKSAGSTNGQVVSVNISGNNGYKQQYVTYLYDYVNYLPIKKNNINRWSNKNSLFKFEDTG